MRRTLWAAALALAGAAPAGSASANRRPPASGTDLRDRRQRHRPRASPTKSSRPWRAHNAGERGVESPTAPSSCATVDDQTDTDGDFQPDDATYTFALPACSFTGFRAVGSMYRHHHPERPDALGPGPRPGGDADRLHVHVHQPGARPAPIGGAEREPDAHRQRARAFRSATGDRGAEPAQPRGRDRRAQPAAELHAGRGQSLAFGQPLPDGTFTRSGTFTWSRGRAAAFTVTTVSPLVWDASCTTDRKISSGETHATLEDGGYIKTVWTACGVDPMRRFVPAS